MKRFPLASRAKAEILTTISAFLYEPYEEHCNLIIDRIIVEHTLIDMKLSKATFLGFRFRGKHYFHSSTQDRPRNLTSLSLELYPQMEEVLKDFETVNLYEKPLILNSVTAMLNESQHPNDFLKVLPECLHPALSTFYQTQYPEYDEELTPEKATEIRERYSKALDAIHVRLATNLILR